MKQIRISIIFTLLSLVLFPSCSVFDDHDGCPCYLTVHYDLFTGQVASSGRNIDILVSDATGIVFDSAVDADSFPEGTDIKVKKGRADMAAWTGMSSMTKNEPYLLVGDECDSLYLYHAVVDCCDDLAEVHVEPLKQFCTLTVMVAGGEVWNGDGDWTLFADYKGIEALTGNPVKGLDETRLRYLGDGVWQCRICRQGDGLLVLVIDGPVGETVTIPLHEIMEESGYDWTGESLEDFTLYIGYAEEGELSWSVLPWKDGGDRKERI